MSLLELQQPLEFRFLKALDKCSDDLTKVFRCKGGVPGRTIRSIMQPISQDCDGLTDKNEMEQTVMGICIICHEGHKPDYDPEDIFMIIEGVEAISSLRSVAMLFGLIYTLNLSYPRKLKTTFEVIQKVFLNLDGQRLSPKAQALKNKMLQ